MRGELWSWRQRQRTIDGRQGFVLLAKIPACRCQQSPGLCIVRKNFAGFMESAARAGEVLARKQNLAPLDKTVRVVRIDGRFEPDLGERLVVRSFSRRRSRRVFVNLLLAAHQPPSAALLCRHQAGRLLADLDVGLAVLVKKDFSDRLHHVDPR